jgi:hypothetical protein
MQCCFRRNIACEYVVVSAPFSERRSVNMAPVCSGVIRRTSNEKRSKVRSNFDMGGVRKRDLNDWCITKKLVLDRREWKLAIHV